MDWLHRFIRPVLMCLCISQAVLATLACIKHKSPELVVFLVACYTTAALQVPSLIWPRHTAILIANGVLYSFQLASSVLLVVAVTATHIVLPQHYGTVLLCLSLATAVLLGVSATLLCLFVPVKSDTESVETAFSDQLSLNKAHQTIPPVLLEPHVITASTQNTEVDEDVSRLVRASMSNLSTLQDYDNGENWMARSLTLHDYEKWADSRLRHSQSSPVFQGAVPVANSAAEEGDDMRRSKSTSQLQVSRVRKRQQRWQSIHDERQFLLSVSENLLPPVLKPGQSAIHELQKTSMATSTIPEEECPRDYSFSMAGLEQIPAPTAWGTRTAHPGMINVSLEDWEQNRAQWLAGPARPMVIGAVEEEKCLLVRSLSAPSLYTFRRASDSSKPEFALFGSLENTLTHCVTPTVVVVESTNSSPIRKVMGMFRRRDSEDHIHAHKHTSSVANSVASHLSVASGKSTRSNSPKKTLRALLRDRSLVSQGREGPCRVPQPPVLSRAFVREDWELDVRLNQSRVSSMPSAVIGEYDKEKWQTLKELERQAAETAGLPPAEI